MMLRVAIFRLIPCNIVYEESRVERKVAATRQGATGLKDRGAWSVFTTGPLSESTEGLRDCSLDFVDPLARLYTTKRILHQCHPFTEMNQAVGVC